MNDYFKELQEFIDNAHIKVDTKNIDLEDIYHIFFILDNGDKNFRIGRQIYISIMDTRCNLFRACDEYQIRIKKGNIKNNNTTIASAMLYNYFANQFNYEKLFHPNHDLYMFSEERR